MEREASPRELTEEEIKTVSGGISTTNQPPPLWNNKGNNPDNPDLGLPNTGGSSGGTWRENRENPSK
jgi:hypothetical protein